MTREQDAKLAAREGSLIQRERIETLTQAITAARANIAGGNNIEKGIELAAKYFRLSPQMVTDLRDAVRIDAVKDRPSLRADRS